MILSDLRKLQADAMQTMVNARGIDPTISDQNTQLNWACRVIARKCCLTKEVALHLVEGQSTYNLRDTTTPAVGAKIIKPAGVFINQRPLVDASGEDYGLWSYDELNRICPGWRTTANGTPVRAVFYNFDKLILHPSPDAGAVAMTNLVFGQYLPNDLSADSDVPELPEEIHEAIAWLAAQLAATPTLSDETAFAKIQQYQTYWTQIIQDVEAQNVSTLQSWGSTNAYIEPNYIFI